MKQRWGLDRNVLRPTPGDPWGVEQHHWYTGAKENQQLNPGEHHYRHPLLNCQTLTTYIPCSCRWRVSILFYLHVLILFARIWKLESCKKHICTDLNACVLSKSMLITKKTRKMSPASTSIKHRGMPTSQRTTILKRLVEKMYQGLIDFYCAQAAMLF